MPLPALTELHDLLRQKLSSRQEVPTRQREFARVEAYWHIGRIIVESEQSGLARAEYGTELIPNLAEHLSQAYGPGYGVANLWWFRQFYLLFPILHTTCGELETPGLRTELTWSHYRTLLPITDKQERDFYLHTAADERWSVRTLKALIHSRYYQQVALGEDALLAGHRPSSPTRTGRRTRVARLRQALLGSPGWALIDRRGADVPLSEPKPDALAYHYRHQVLVGVWLSDYSAARAEAIRRQLATWAATFPPGSPQPVGVLVAGRAVWVGQPPAPVRETLGAVLAALA